MGYLLTRERRAGHRVIRGLLLSNCVPVILNLCEHVPTWGFSGESLSQRREAFRGALGFRERTNAYSDAGEAPNAMP
jgi:hypothetical protein